MSPCQPERCEQAEAEIRSVASADARIDFLIGDFCEMAEVKRIADEIRGLTDQVHVLINNAGGVRDQRYVSTDGIEATITKLSDLAQYLTLIIENTVLRDDREENGI